MGLLAALTFLLNVSLGSVRIPLAEGLSALWEPRDSGAFAAIIRDIRLPRALAAASGGAALAVTGLLLQVLFQNPIVDSFILGVSSGASLLVGVVLLAGTAFGIQAAPPQLLVGAAFLGAMAVMLLVLGLARRVKSVVTLLVAGLMVGYLCSGITSGLVVLAQREQLRNFILWGLGSFSGYTMGEALFLTGLVLPLAGAACFLAKPLNALLLGEKYARSGGAPMNALRCSIILITSLLGGAVTAFSGPIAFIGLAVPHLARIIWRTSDNRMLIPACFLLGGAVAGSCDLLARLLFAPVELPISAVTSFFGAPLVIGLLLKRSRVA
jgi:iron complex transport system permease protein